MIRVIIKLILKPMTNINKKFEYFFGNTFFLIYFDIFTIIDNYAPFIIIPLATALSNRIFFIG